MQRAVVILLAILAFANNVVWAADLHVESLTESHETKFSEPLSGAAIGDSDACDHCCHGSTHHVALREGGEQTPSLTLADALFLSRFDVPSDWLNAPPTPPPNA